MAGADAPGPARGGVVRAAPGVVPGEQIVRGVLAGAYRAGRRADTVADLLEVLVVHGVAQIVAHLRRLADGRGHIAALALRLGPHVGPVRGLHGPRVGVRRVGVLPLPGVRGVPGEEVQVAVRGAVLEGVAGRLRHRLPHRLLRAALEGVDVRRSGRGRSGFALAGLVAVAVDVVDVLEPVHAVHVVRAVRALQFGRDRVGADGDARVELGRVLVRVSSSGAYVAYFEAL